MNYIEYNLRKSGMTLEENDKSRIKGHQRILDILVRDNIKKGLDYGTGTGWLTKYMNSMGKKWIGREIVFPDQHFDCVASINVIEHMEMDEILDFLLNCKQHTDYVIISTNNPRCLNAYFTLYNDITHTRLISMESMIAMLDQFGFKVIVAEYFDDLVKNPIQKAFIKVAYAMLGLGKFRTEARYFVYAWRK